MAKIESGTSSDLLTVDATSKAARTSLYNPGGVSLAGNDYDLMTSPSGIVTAGLNDDLIIPTRSDRFGNVGIINNTPIVWEQWENATLNSYRWTAAQTTFVQAITTTGNNMNSTNLTTASAVATMLSNRRIFRSARNPIQYKARIRVTNFANSQNDFGLCDGIAGAAQIANGAYFQITTAGVVQGVVTTASTDNAVALDFTNATGGAFDGTKTYTWDILIDDDSVIFTVQETLTGKLAAKAAYTLGLTSARLFAVTHLAAFNRCFNTATPPATAATHLCHFVYLGFIDFASSTKQWPHILAGNQFGSILNPSTFVQAATFTNSAEPASMTLSNTAAGLTTLGGKFQFAAVAGAATDYVIFGFTVPSPFTLYVTGITIYAWNTGAAVATTATLLTWGCYADSTAVSAATTQTRRFLGSQSFAIGSVVGAAAPQIERNFTVPLVTSPGRFFGILLRMPVGTATASQVIAGAVDIDGYFE